MFQLVTISDVIQILPEDFGKPSAVALRDNIQNKYEDQVIQKVGLGIGLGDIISASDGLIAHGAGVVNVKVTFRLIVFRPFKGEVIEAIIMWSSEDGIKCALNSHHDGPRSTILALDFFNDIWVPKENLPENCEFHPDERAWRWNFGGSEFYLDQAERVRLRVEQEVWTDQSPEKPLVDSEAEETDKAPPYQIIASMSLPGLGPNTWWDDADNSASAETEDPSA